MDRERSRRTYLRLLAAAGTGAVAGCAGLTNQGTDQDRPPGTEPETTERRSDVPTDTPVERIDDWQYDPTTAMGGGSTGSGGTATAQATAVAMDAASSGGGGDVGLAAGGAKDIATFRRNVEEGYLPIPESLSYEGLFYNYYFDTGGDGSCSSTFCPTYSPAVTADPLSGETERYLTVGLNSGIATADFDRKKLNLVVVLDISGSMSASFDQYYYDRFGNRREVEEPTDREKIAVARDALVSLTEQLRPGDRLGVVLYNNDSAVAKPLRPVEATDMDAIRDHIQEDIRAGGGTNLDAGLADATELLSEYSDADQSSYENRMIVLTDAMPNLGDTTSGGLRGELEANAENNIHATFVGIGVDFNAELVDELTAVRGANYYAVHSAEEFERRLGEEFEYMVTPLVFDLQLELDAEGYDIEKVYGSTAAEEATGQLMSVNTLFASPSEGGKARGGVVLVQVDRQSEDATMTLRASWEGRDGTARETASEIEFPSGGPEQFANTGVRKAVLLSRYADLLKRWMVYERDQQAVEVKDGIEVLPEEMLGRWEQQSDPLTVTPPYDERIRQFEQYFREKMSAIGDEELDQELAMLEGILAAA
jgi:Ca-activated chloride channel family protein